MVDYLTLVRSERGGRSRTEEVGKISKALLQLAKEMAIPVIELAQLNRDSTKRPGKKPQSSDLRDSGEIEVDASCILMVRRHMDTEEGQNGLTEILMTKCRHARVGSCTVQQEGQYGRFATYAGSLPSDDEAGRRSVKLLRPALEALTAQKAHTLLADKEVFQNPRPLECWAGDQPIRKTMWHPAMKKAGVRYRRPYQTWHTYASMMLSAGEHPMWVAKQMGHSNWAMISRVYGKWTPHADKLAGSKAESIFATRARDECSLQGASE